MSSEKDINKHYEDQLTAEEYYEDMTKFIRGTKEIIEATLSFICDTLKSGKFKGSKVLEIGSACCVHGVATASMYYPNVIMSDFVEDNCKELRKWMKGESKFDWTEHLNVVAALEDDGGDLEAKRREIEAQIRKSVKCVVKCDVFSEEVIAEEELKSDETRPPYDLIICLLTLQSTALNYSSYVSILRRFKNLLRSGGGIIVSDFDNGNSYWGYEDKQFHYLTMSLDQVKDAVNEAGFKNMEVKSLPKQKRVNGYFNYDTFFCYLAEKST